MTSHQDTPEQSSLKQRTLNRRTFLKSTATAGGGLLLSFSWFAEAKTDSSPGVPGSQTAHELNAFLQISSDNVVTIRVPIPEFGQNLMTSMPMILAEELDVDWEAVQVEQAPFDTSLYQRQFAGGSQSIKQSWQSLRKAGATARHMLVEAAARKWSLPADELGTRSGEVFHKASGQSVSYGALAEAAAGLVEPDNVELKSPDDFSLVGSSKRNVAGKNIVTGQPLFTMDYRPPGTLIAMIVHAPAFGMTLESFDAKAALDMPGIVDVFAIETLPQDAPRDAFDTNAFPQLVAIVGESTWQVMNAKKALDVNWKPFDAHDLQVTFFGRKGTIKVPAGLESSDAQSEAITALTTKPGKVLRKDGDPETAFKSAAKVIERTYNAPFLAHNTMEPMNFFAHVTKDRAVLKGPVQAPEFIERTLSQRLDMPLENIDIEMMRMGGGFGRRAYSHYAVEAALISQKVGAPVNLVYSREDDMTYGAYRPRYQATYRAALNEKNEMIGYHLRAGGIPESPVAWLFNRFPAGAVDHCLIEGWSINSNITIAAFRAPASNFIGATEQAFLDEVAEIAGQDPIDFRMKLLKRATKNPVGNKNDYDPGRYAGVLKLAREKSGWDEPAKPGVSRGIAAYFCHNSYVAHAVDIVMDGDTPKIDRACSAVDCGIVVNKDAAKNMVEGAVVDGIGNALFGEMTFTNGVPDKNNFHNYRMIRMSEAPNTIDVHFVESQVDPTGLGEPPFPPVFAALANALYQATGKRLYNQPFHKGGRSA